MEQLSLIVNVIVAYELKAPHHDLRNMDLCRVTELEVPDSQNTAYFIEAIVYVYLTIYIQIYTGLLI